MFNAIEIDRFRGIRHSRIEGFKQINLFFGKNNCGKSSLLEAIFLASGISNPVLPFNVNLMRGYHKSALNDLKLDFYNMDSSLPIHIRMVDGEIRDLNISLFEETQQNFSIDKKDSTYLSSVKNSKYGLKLDFSINAHSFQSQLLFDNENSNSASQVLDSQYTETIRCTYLSPKYDFEVSIQGLKNILQNKDEHFIIDGLRILDPNVNDFMYNGTEMLVDIGLDKRIPVNMMGDGARKIVSLLSSLYDCKRGTLLIDEISNGFHYSVMPNLWRVLIEAAIKNNTQLFITTHDIDSIKGLRDAASKRHESIVATYKLQRDLGGELKYYHYSIDSLDYAINQAIEVR